MHLPTLTRRRRLDVRLDHDVPPISPRKAAVLLLAEKIANGQAGLDPFDSRIFILVATANERTWAYRALELTGVVLSTGHAPHGGARIRGILEADIRIDLHLDDVDAPLMLDEPLASRGVAGVLLDAALENTETETRAAIARAHQAWERRYANEQVH